MKLIYALILAIGLAGCAVQPEVVLKRGYDASSATVRSTTVLVTRDQISVKDAEAVKALGTTAKATLDQGKTDLAKCRATPGANCNVQPNTHSGPGSCNSLRTI